MNQIDIGSRLSAAASCVEGGRTVWDVGCDHGKLSLYLIQTGRAKRIIATDINEKPLQKAVDLFRSHSLEDRAVFFTADGLDNAPEGEDISHIVIAGMGGNTIASILSSSDLPERCGATLVLLPAQREETLRQFLFGGGYRILSEEAVEENGKYYVCLTCVYDGVKRIADLLTIFAGQPAGSAAVGYLEKRLGQMRNVMRGVARDEKDRYARAIEEGERILAGMKNGGGSRPDTPDR